MPAVPAACNPTEFRIAIDVGHTEKNYGAMSARNKPEFEFNLRLANDLLEKLQGAGFSKSEVVVQPDNDLSRRARELSSRRPNLMLSLHHDSVQDQFLQRGELEGVMRTYTKHARGYSIFVSRDNSRLEQSKQFARMLGQEMLRQGLKPTMHHNEPIAGENRPIYDREAGVFFYDGLVVLRQTIAPAVLLESAVITEPDDERRAEDPLYRARITNAILGAVGRLCEASQLPAAAVASPKKKR
jgi:N-acetylmuramoyl-L-alanine amidase